MQLPEFFIKRPVFASVLSAMIVAVGLVSLQNIAVREYPDVTLPTLTVMAHYPNASAELVETRVTNPLEDSLAGVPGLKAMSSQTTDNNSEIKLFFKAGASIDAKLVAVRDAVEKVRSDLPKDLLSPIIQRGGERSGPPFIAITFSSKSLKPEELTHFVNIQYKNVFRSIEGISTVEMWSPPYTMAVTLDPKQLYALGLNIEDVTQALNAKKEAFAAGKLHNDVPVSLSTALETEDDFKNLVIKQGDLRNKPVLLKQVADIVQRADNYEVRVRVNGKPGAVLAIKLASDANPLEVSRTVGKEVERIKAQLPDDMSVTIDVDNAGFIRASIKNIEKSLMEAFLLVFGIILLFMRNFRACLVPLITIPISLIGVLGVFYACGLSINIITLLAIILAIGLVVDDGIVVLENIQRHIEEGRPVRQAAIEGSKEIGFAVIAMTLTLASVYAPIAFLQSTIGFLFREFSIALAGAVIISGIVSLTLCPMLCARLLKPKAHTFFPAFDVFLGALTTRYGALLDKVLDHKKYVLAFMVAAFVGAGFLVKHLPEEMAPPEDRGLIGAYTSPVPGKGIGSQDKFAVRVEQELLDIPEAENRITFVGTWGSSTALILKDWSKRDRSASVLTTLIKGRMEKVPSLDIWAWDYNSALPGVEIGNSNGLRLVLLTVKPYKDLYEKAEKLMEELKKTGLFTNVSQSLRLNSPSWKVKVDPYHQSLFGITDSAVAKALKISLSQDRTISYMKDGISYTVLLKTNTDPSSISEVYMVNKKGERASLDGLATFTRFASPSTLEHHNQQRASILTLDLKEGIAMGDAVKIVGQVSKQVLDNGYSVDWVGATKEFLEASFGTNMLFVLAVLFIFAILAIQFESMRDPLFIILTVPLASLGALGMMWLMGVSLNIYSKIGLVTLVGLITKHGILLVEMANHLTKTGKTPKEAAIGAAQLRLRPILMTTGAMVFGVIPLAVGVGAGAEARQAIGWTLLGGLLFGTLTTLFVIPACYALQKKRTV